MNLGRSRGTSSIATTAALSVALLLAAIGSYIGEHATSSSTRARDRAPEAAPMPQYAAIEDADGNGTPDWQDELQRTGLRMSIGTAVSSTTEPDPAAALGTTLLESLVNGYVSLKESDSYTLERGEQLADTLVTNFKAPGDAPSYSAEDLNLVADTSQAGTLRYRSDMRTALEGIVDLEAEPELSLFARFIATSDTKWLSELSRTAADYRVAEQNLLAVEVPQSAASVHLRAVNAVSHFAQTLERLVRFSNDPLATMALLRTYNESEREFLLAFDALAKFYVEDINGN